MRLTFFGTTDFAIPTLKAIYQAGYQINPVVTVPAQPQGRGRKLLPSPVAVTAMELGLKTLTPDNPNQENFLKILQEYRPDCGVLVAYGYILKEPLLRVPRLGFINLHPSLLPRYRGAAPIPRQLMDGCQESGVTVIAMDKKVDSGAILNQIRTPVDPEETAGELSARLAKMGAELILTTLIQLKNGSVLRQPQAENQATVAPKITRADRIVNWQETTEQIHNRIRALSPQPGAITFFRNKQLILLRSRILTGEPPLPPGSIVLDRPGLVVATATGIVEILQLKPAGGKVIIGKDFRNGYRLQIGEKLELM